MKTTQNSGPAKSLLIVDDEPMVIELFSCMIPKLYPGIAIHFAENGKSGIELFKEHMPDIVITDIIMPHIDGLQMVREIKSIKTDTFIIVITADKEIVHQETIGNIGVNEFLFKPVELFKLFIVLDKCLGI